MASNKEAAGNEAAQAASTADKKAPVNPAMTPPVEVKGDVAKIEMLVSISFPHGTFDKGAVIELPAEQAQRYVDRGSAKPVKG